MAEHKMQVVNGIRVRPEDVDDVRDRLTAAGHAIEEPVAKRRRAPRKAADGGTPPNPNPLTGGEGDGGQDDGTGTGEGDGSASS